MISNSKKINHQYQAAMIEKIFDSPALKLQIVVRVATNRGLWKYAPSVR